jgi:hypothetical protein
MYIYVYMYIIFIHLYINKTNYKRHLDFYCDVRNYFEKNKRWNDM